MPNLIRREKSETLMSLPSPLQVINHPLFARHNVQVLIKRDDLIHPIISGNKWRKLKYNIEAALTHHYDGIISFGGAYSNHIHALAFACWQQKINCLGIIRGEAHYHTNFTLSWAQHWGMKLQFVDRKTYRLRQQTTYLSELKQQYKNHLIVPEGGSNALAIKGMAEVITELNQQCSFDSLLTPVGSGGTLAGLITADKNQHQLMGIGVLKGCNYLEDDIKALLPATAKDFTNWQLFDSFHRGGYAKFSSQDALRILEFSQQSNIDFEPVYSGKMILALFDLLESGFFSAKQRIVLLHTGGLQGLGGMVERGLLDGNQWPTPPPIINYT